jgi:hypothetical protein
MGEYGLAKLGAAGDEESRGTGKEEFVLLREGLASFNAG